ncbi:unnamed protein product [Caenorhabditis nigoni]
MQIARYENSFEFFSCQVCKKPAHGKHFGAITCRACAAFFRRSGTISKSVYRCDQNNNCEILRNGRFACKKCKLRKCLKVGMDDKKFIFGRDLISATEDFMRKSRQPIIDLPETIEHLSGRPLFVIYMDPKPLSPNEKSFINIQYLIDEGVKIMDLGSEKPIFAENCLKKLAMGLRKVRDGAKCSEIGKLTKIGKAEAIGIWERDFLAVAKWLSYFSEFEQLPRSMKISLLKSIWHVWTRLEKLALTAESRKNEKCRRNEMMLDKNSFYDQENFEVDISWCTKYPKEKLKFFFDEPHHWMDFSIIDSLIALEPTDIELVYMMCQLCFQYAGKRHQGEILETCEKFLNLLANDLHGYYTNDVKCSRYLGRLNQMMRINNMIQEDIRGRRVKRELAETFQIFCTELSHPEMFEDT